MAGHKNAKIAVSREDFDFLMEQKRKKFELDSVNIDFQRRLRVKQIDIELAHKNQAIAFKKHQIDTGQLLEKHEDFIDGKKPRHILEYEIGILRFDIESLQEQKAEVLKLLGEKKDD